MRGVGIKQRRHSGDGFILPLANELDPSEGNAVNLILLPNKCKGDDFVVDDNPTAVPDTESQIKFLAT
jgi:hypothetical protein